MMCRVFIVVAVMGFVAFLGGCSTKSAPDFARILPEDGVSAQLPEDGVITVIPGILPAEFLVEVKNGVKGVWPIVGHKAADSQTSLTNGFCFAMEGMAFEKNPWGIVAPLKCVVVGSKKELAGYTFALVNKDGGVWITSPVGGEMLDDTQWNFQKFEGDHAYRTSVMDRIGLTIEQVNDFWEERFAELGITVIDGSVEEIRIVHNNPKWQEFQEEFIREMGYQLEMPNGKTVVSHLSAQEMQKLLAKNPHITGWQKFLSRLTIPIGTPEVMLFGTATSVLQGGIAALIEDDWRVRVARGTVQLRDTKEQTLFLVQKIQSLHERAVRAEMGR